MILPVVTETNYFLEYSPEWENIQTNEIVVPVDSSDNEVTIHLPNSSSFAGKGNFNIRIQAVSFSENIYIAPQGSDQISGSRLLTIESAPLNISLEFSLLNEWFASYIQGGSLMLTGNATLASFNTITFRNAPVGTMMIVSRYNGTGDGGCFYKTQQSALNQNDWVVMSTTNAAVTGTMGNHPI